MFRNLMNEAKVNFKLKLDSPLSIRSGSGGGIDPTLPDMQCIRTFANGRETVFIPGSSLKGVVRSRCEKLISFFSGKVCNPVDRKNACDIGSKQLNGEEVYKEMCHACRMFGSCSLGGRVKFKDAYPTGEVKMGFRNGVGINRITGAAQSGALYDFEVVEEGTFQVEITLVNYELYQLKLLLFAINDINSGYVSLGSSTTRGNGKVLVEDLNISFRDYRRDTEKLSGYYQGDMVEGLNMHKELYYKRAQISGLDESIMLLEDIDIEKDMRGNK